MSDVSALQAKLKALNEAYAAQLPEKIAQLELAWDELPREAWDEGRIETIHRMAHSLTGSGKTFGYSLISDVARKLEDYLHLLAQAKLIVSDEQRAAVRSMLSQLHNAAIYRDVAEPPGLIMQARADAESADRRSVCIVEDDREIAEMLRVQLSYFGYEVRVFHTLQDFRAAADADPDAIIVADVGFPEDGMGGINAVREIQRRRTSPQPVIFISTQEDFLTRLEAVRSGALAYLTKPLNIASLVDKLDALASPLASSQYRVLLVDDSISMTTLISSVLEQAGMVVKVVNNPILALDALNEFLPDLILLDIYMPDCNGMELAKVIRQQDIFVSIPIVFLSVEEDLEKQLFAMGLGGDEFLVKPIKPDHLVATVANRIRRAHTLRSFMVRDSLTGLLNHTAIHEQLDREIAQAARRKAPLSFAMLDIDHFKRVNDVYGHPVGDQVLKRLSQMLKQRLRRTDTVGRYGGEEFALVLSDVNASAAFKMLDTIRNDFSTVRHHAGEKEFAVTFSCGVADFPSFGKLSTLCEAADKALYEAKHAGRNNVKKATKIP